MAEELVRVESFDELGSGMLVVEKDCPFCNGKTHRHFLLNRSAQEVRKTPGSALVKQQTFDVACEKPEGATSRHAVSASDVAEGRIYRVVDGLEKTVTTKTRRPAEVTR